MPPRSKKDDTGELMVSINDYTRTRDSVIVSLTNLQAGLTHVQNGLNDLLRAYMQHTASILAGESGDLDKLQLPANITATANAAMEAATTVTHGLSQVVSAAPAEPAAPAVKQRRKRAPTVKDPNAPKKPLTAMFLFAQTARPIVKADLQAAQFPGQPLEKNAVNIEINKRWNELPPEAKEEWKQSYRNSREQWELEMAEYRKQKGGEAPDVEMEDASEEGEAEIEADAGALESDASSDEDEELVSAAKAVSPPAKTPRANKRQKLASVPAPNGASTPATANTVTPVPLPTGARGTQAPQPASSVEPPAATKKERKRKDKTTAPAQPIAPAPPAQHEPSPEETGKPGKKGKGRSTRGGDAEVDKENGAGTSQEKRKRKRKSEGASA